MSGPLAVAQASWGADLPDWVAALARECEAASQNRVAARMDRSATIISRVLRRSYAGSYEAVEQVFRGVFMAAVVECPQLGTIPSNDCADWRRKARHFASVNSLRVDMYRACNGCPRNRKEDGNAP